MRTRNLFSLAFASCLFFSAPAWSSWDEDLPKLDFRIQDGALDHSKPLAPYQFVLQGYAPMDFKTLFQLYWKAGVVTTDNTDAVVDYLRTIECKVYQATYKNDFLWPEVMRSTINYLNGARKQFNNRVTILQPIALDRYDPEKDWFIVTSDTQYLNVLAMTVSSYQAVRSECEGNDDINIGSIPTKANIRMGYPFSLTYLKMKPDFAKRYIDYMDGQKTRIDIEGSARARYAFVRFYFTVTGFEASRTTSSEASFMGNMDGYVIYADRAETMPLTEWINPRLGKKDFSGSGTGAPEIEMQIVP